MKGLPSVRDVAFSCVTFAFSCHIERAPHMPNRLQKKKNDYQTPRRRVGKIHAEVQPSDVNETEGYRKQGRPTKRWDDDVHFMPTQSSQRQPQSHKRHDLAHRGTIRDSMESDSVSSRLKQPTTPVTPIVSTTEAKPTPAVQTTHTHASLLILSQRIEY